MKGEWHVSKDGIPRECQATIKCPLGAGESHFTTQQEAQEYADNKFEEVTSYNTETVLKKHNRNEGIFISKNVENVIKNYRTKINHLATKEFGKYYSKLVKEAQKNRENTPSKARAMEQYEKESNLGYLKGKLTEFEEEIKEIAAQRQQAVRFYHTFKKYIKDRSFSNASGSAYFIVEKRKVKEITKYLAKQGYEVDLRPMLDATKGETFQLRFADHYPKEYYKAKRRNKKRKKETDVWKCTDVSMLVSYQKVPKNNRSAMSVVNRFLGDYRNDI